jgi:hypothetical protein
VKNQSYEIKMLNRLTARVAARNQVNALLNLWHPKIQEVLKKWIGQKVSLVTGGKPAKLKAELDALGLPSDWRCQIIISFDRYSAKVHYKVSVSIMGEGDQNAEAMVYLGNMTNGLILTDLSYEFVPYRVDYTVTAVQDALAKVKDAEKALDQAKGALYPFGEHDNN